MNSRTLTMTMTLSLSLTLLSLLGAKPVPTHAQPDLRNPGFCVDDLGCSLLGDCVDNRCVCDEGWTGSNCQTPDLILQPSLEGFDNPLYPTWGGHSTYADGKWNLFAEGILNQCSIWDYEHNGAYMRATADFPTGPWTFAEYALPAFHHGTQVARGPRREYLLFGDGRDMPSYTVHTNCNVFRNNPNGGKDNNGRRALEAGSSSDSNATSASALVPASPASASLRGSSQSRKNRPRRPPRGENLYPRGNSPQDVHFVAVADKVTGPWTQHVILRTDLSRGVNRWDCNITNLSPLILSNGTVVMAFRGKPCVENLNANCGMHCQSVGIAVSESGFMGPYVRRPNPIEALDGNEDPFLWQNKRGFLMLLHGKLWPCGDSQNEIDTCGTLAYSRDSYTWYKSPWVAYTGLIRFADGSREMLDLRQRPKITFDNFGTPLVLHTSAKRFNRPYVQNVMMRFNTKAMRDYRAPLACPRNVELSVGSCMFAARRKTRDARGCAGMGQENCVWCPSQKRCMPGIDSGVCGAAEADFPALFRHC